MERIAVLTSGGDAPGMNAAIRAVVRTAIVRGLEVFGVRRGYTGLVRAEFVPLDSASVGGIIEEGGTILRAGRNAEFQTPAGLAAATENLRRAEVDALVAIGGNGTQTGALALHRGGIPTVGVASTIDNDINGTDFTIGSDTALNTVVEAIDRIRDTASAHERTFLVETMGRDSGWIALNAALATGADIVLIPEVPYTVQDVCGEVQRRLREHKAHTIIVVAEGAGSAIELGKTITAMTGVDTRVTVLGHLQRGGAPSAFDRILASRLGAAAAEAAVRGESGIVMGVRCADVVPVPLEIAIQPRPKIDWHLYQLEGVFSI